MSSDADLSQLHATRPAIRPPESPTAAEPAVPAATAPHDRPAAEARPIPAVLADRAALLIPLALYLIGAVVLSVRIGRHSANAYNWENYTAWGVFHFWDGLWAWADLWRQTDGLMTDSGESPLVALPVWLGWKLFGVGVVGLRVPLILVSALAVPLAWLVGRRLVASWAAGLGALLLAISPVFLLYGRTATLVGVSLAPALLTIYALLRLVRPEQLSRRAWLGWLVALQALLIADQYAYSVLRFLWLIALVLFAVEAVFRRGEWRRLAPALVLTALVLPAALSYLGHRDGFGWNPKDAVVRSYNGRGEQILRLNDDPGGYRYYLRQTDEEEASGGPDGSAGDLAARLIRQNAGDYVKLLLDQETRPAIVDFWNPQGRLYPQLLVPFFLLGLLVAAIRFWQPTAGVEARALLALFFGFGLPLFLTSRVHIGRLIFALPFLFVLVGLGLAALRGTEGRRDGETERASPSVPPSLRPSVSVALAVIVVVLTTQAAWSDYRVSPGPSREWLRAQALLDNRVAAGAAGGAALVAADGVGAEIEAIDAAATRLHADDVYRFVNLAELPVGTPPPAADAGDDRPVLYVGRILDRLRRPETMPALCTTLYFVRPDAEDAFLDATSGGRPAGCPAPLEYVVLPG